MINKTVVIQIGNTDNKLTQQDWCAFVESVADLFANLLGVQVHFFGGSPTYAAWQNVCWVIELDLDNEDYVKTQLIMIRKKYLQNSVAWLEGETKFL